ncbi:hypothetical protein FA95DRAFT_1563824 [Auriscalpium vulgare]|uniref:Uncharacterized protein n=1 Tax=Auriscalpium vulgare TaxID=40419 RepID=A0ACB8RFL3_9AGAM|nr:hypothetical protein FA95DRAFT_1563824 [Auriscalpium vulgare]
MAAVASRRPLNHRRPLHQPHPAISPVAQMAARSGSSGTKRTRSPEPLLELQSLNSKRPRATASPSITPAPQDDTKERRRVEREAQREDFKVKYTRAFPGFVFHLHWDIDESVKKRVTARIERMGSRVEDFFSKDSITHFITNKSIPSEEFLHNNKENLTASGSRTPSALKSPIRLRGRAAEEPPVNNDDNLLLKAVEWKMKVWTVAKLESVLDRCQAPLNSAPSKAPVASQQSLSRLLESEKIHGTTERDPTQRQLGFRYFSKNSYFVLIEDLNQDFSTIHATEYPIRKSRDGKETGSWPVPYCDARSRGPFIEFDANEERRAARSEKQERAREQERLRRKARLREQESRRQMKEAEAKRSGDLRRTVSMVNLQRRISLGEDGDRLIDLDAELEESANASGYLASGQYMAASGNSVSVTSTTGTTSTSGRIARSMQLPAMLRDRRQQEVLTSRRVAGDKDKKGDMGPPSAIPERKFLKKSKSTNTMRLSKREEGAKPGYCECCRQKFEDFDKHVTSKKHRKYATNEAHFLQLDYVLGRLRRQTKQEVAEASARLARPRHHEDTDETSPTRSEGTMDDDDGREHGGFSSSEEVADYLPQPRPPPAWGEDIDLDADGEDEEL